MNYLDKFSRDDRSYDQWQHREDNFSRKPERRENDEFMAVAEHVKACPNCGWPVTSWPCICGYGGKPAQEPSQRRQQVEFERSAADTPSRIGLRQRGEEQAGFYCSGTCICGCSRGDHDYPVGPCMNSGCGCKRLTLRSASEAA